MSSRLSRSTDGTHFVAQPRRGPACSVISGPFVPQKGVQDIGRMQGKTSVSQAYCRSRLRVRHKKADQVGSMMRPCEASTLVSLPSSVRADMSRAHPSLCLESTFSLRRWCDGPIKHLSHFPISQCISWSPRGMALVLELERQRHFQQDCLETP